MATAAGGLNRDLILDAALALIDRHGVDGFSVRDLARQLGVYPTALYWHVPGRNALIAGAAERVLADLEPPWDEAHPPHWRDWLRELFQRYRHAVRAHPALAAVLGAQLVSNEALSPSLVDHLLAALEQAGFRDEALVSAYNVAVAAMVGFVTLELAPLPADDPEGWARGMQARLDAVDAGRHPRLHRLLPQLRNRAFIVRWDSGVDHPLDASFEAWIATILAGLAAGAPAGPQAGPAQPANKGRRARTTSSTAATSSSASASPKGSDRAMKPRRAM